MNVLLINDSSSNPNWGDRAAAIALKQMIIASGGILSGIITELELSESRFFQSSPVEEDAPDSGRRKLKDWARLLLPPAVLKLREKVLRRLVEGRESGPIPITLDDFERCADAILRAPARYGGLIRAIETADVTLIHGDGCMVGHSILPRSELFLAHLIKTRFGKPVVLVNHTTDFSHRELDRMAVAVYPRLDDVTYRDQTSADLCRGRWPGRYAADSAFLFEPAPREEWVRLAFRPTYFDVWPDRAAFDPDRPYVCIGGSSIYSFDGRPTEVIDGFIALASYLRAISPAQMVLTASDVKDQVILRPVAKALGLPLVGLTTPVQQAVDILGNAQAYVGGRWHPSIFAMRGGTPVVPLASKTFKMPALSAMAGLPTAIFDAHNLQAERAGIGQALEALVAEGEPLRRKLRQWAAEQAEGSWDNVAYLRRQAEILATGKRQ